MEVMPLCFSLTVMGYIAGTVGGRMVTRKTLDLPWQLKDVLGLEITHSMKTPAIGSLCGGRRGYKRLSSEYTFALKVYLKELYTDLGKRMGWRSSWKR